MSLGRKDFDLAYNRGVFVVFPWCSGPGRFEIRGVPLCLIFGTKNSKHQGTPGGFGSAVLSLFSVIVSCTHMVPLVSLLFVQLYCV